MENKLGSYINNLMNTIRDTEEKSFLRALTLDELKKINDDISGFIFQHIDEIETLAEFEEDTSDKAKELYMEHWTCELCGKHTHEVDYDYLSGTDHLECVLGKENNRENQTKLEFKDEWRAIENPW